MADHDEHDELELDDRGGRMAAIAARVRMTEGQLYTAVVAACLVALMSLTGLPTAQRVPGGPAGAPTIGAPAAPTAPGAP